MKNEITFDEFYKKVTKNISKNLMRIQGENGYTNSQMSVYLDISSRTYDRLIGKNFPEIGCSFRTFCKIAYSLKIDWNDIFG